MFFKDYVVRYNMETCELVSSLIMSCSWSPNPNGVVQHPLEEKNAPKLYLQLKEEEQVRQKVYFYKKVSFFMFKLCADLEISHTSGV